MQKPTTTFRSKLLLSLAVLMFASNLVGCSGPSAESYRMGLAHSYNVNYSSAIAEFTTAITKEPNHAEYYYARGYAYERQGNQTLTAAVADYNKVIELAPKFANAYFRRAEAYSQMGRYQDAIADSKKVLEMCPLESGPVSQMVRDYQKLGDETHALELTVMFAKTTPDERKSFEQVYDAATKVHNQETRLWACDQLERFNTSNFHNACHCRGTVLYEQGKYQKAIENFTKAIKTGGFEDDCLFQRGQAKAALNQTAEALKDFDKAFKLREINYYSGARGVAAYHLGKYDDAIRDLSFAVMHGVEYRGWHKYLAMAYDKKGLKDLAKKENDTYAKMHAPNPENSDPLPPNWSLEPPKK
jgi:tetratricopeptide (TPR) repeat protein